MFFETKQGGWTGMRMSIGHDIDDEKGIIITVSDNHNKQQAKAWMRFKIAKMLADEILRIIKEE